jgi:hypothetical protein
MGFESNPSLHLNTDNEVGSMIKNLVGTLDGVVPAQSNQTSLYSAYELRLLFAMPAPTCPSDEPGTTSKFKAPTLAIIIAKYTVPISLFNSQGLPVKSLIKTCGDSLIQLPPSSKVNECLDQLYGDVCLPKNKCITVSSQQAWKTQHSQRTHQTCS